MQGQTLSTLEPLICLDSSEPEKQPPEMVVKRDARSEQSGEDYLDKILF
jgi:hypothetical protein